MTETRRKWTWQGVSRLSGLTIVTALLISFLSGQTLDRTLALAFLGIASGLLGLPGGYAIVRRNNERRNGPR